MSQFYQKLGLVLVILSLVGFLWPGNILADNHIKITDQVWEANFRESITFRLSAESTTEIVEVDLLYRVIGQPATSRNEADFTPGTSVTAQFVIDQTRPENYLPPGTEIEYWWKVVDAAGNELKTEKDILLYLDNRYDWQTLENERLALYWYEGGDDFGQKLFDRADLALDTLETDIGIALENPIKIFIYANHNDLLGAVSTNAQDWTGGQAFTRYGVVVIGVSPRQLNWGLNATTHEMTHLVIHQATENPFGDLPRWLDEGIAVYNENRDELDEDFRLTFERAVKNDELMTLRALSSPFPADPMQANLAYGQSGAVVKFIIDTYGSEAMAELLAIFAEGALYDEALEQALGVDTDSLDNEFRASLGLSPLPGTESKTVTEAEISQEEASVAESEEGAEPEQSGETEAEAEAPAKSTEVEAPVEAPAETPERVPLGLPCLAGMIPLLIFGLVYVSRH